MGLSGTFLGLSQRRSADKEAGSPGGDMIGAVELGIVALQCFGDFRAVMLFTRRERPFVLCLLIHYVLLISAIHTDVLI